MDFGIPKIAKKRVVIVGGGFAGITLIKNLDDKLFQTVLIDRNNYHQFQPLIYQVASSGLDADSICFPFRKMCMRKKDFHFRLASVTSVDTEHKVLHTSVDDISYDYLVIATGTVTNFFGNSELMQKALPMKTVEEAMLLRNKILLNFEEAVCLSPKNRDDYMNIVVVGGGATGVEVAGVLSEMKRYVLSTHYKELGENNLNIIMVESAPRLLASMSESASKAAYKALTKMGVEIKLKTRVTDFNGKVAMLNDGSQINTRTVIWVCGVTGNPIQGLPAEAAGPKGRVLCDEYMRVAGCNDIFVAGDLALTSEPAYPKGHPQLAQVAMQQAMCILKNLKAEAKGKEPKPFRYFNMGAMATIGRNKAVADLGKFRFSGIFAWLLWMVIHLRSILGIRKKILVLFDWVINYLQYNQSIRLILFRGRR